jgi:hypothetical protein
MAWTCWSMAATQFADYGFLIADLSASQRAMALVDADKSVRSRPSHASRHLTTM